MVKRVYRNGEGSIWCSKCSEHARQRLEVKWMNRCKLKKMETTQYGEMLRRSAQGQEEFEVGGTMARKHCATSPRKRMLEDRGALPGENGDLLREYQAAHEEHFLQQFVAGGCGR